MNYFGRIEISGRLSLINTDISWHTLNGRKVYFIIYKNKKIVGDTLQAALTSLTSYTIPIAEYVRSARDRIDEFVNSDSEHFTYTIGTNNFIRIVVQIDYTP